MSLFSNITNDLKTNWENSNYFTRGILGISLFLSVSSITSLSDMVFKWKGFILNGLEFYRDYISSPLLNLLSKIGLHYNQTTIDLLLLIGIFLVPVGINKLMLHNDVSRRLATLVSYLVFIVFVLNVGIFSDEVLEVSDLVSFVSLLIPVFFIFIAYIYCKHYQQYCSSVIVIPVSSILIVCILAAVNEGLSR